MLAQYQKRVPSGAILRQETREKKYIGFSELQLNRLPGISGHAGLCQANAYRIT